MPPDLREADRFLVEAYVLNEVQLAKARGQSISEADVPIPKALDYIMFAL